MLRVVFLGLLLCWSLPAQLLTRSITANGSATVSVPPDQATIDAGVTTSGTSAQDAASKNATQTTNLLAALTKVVASNGMVTTTNYYVYPVYQTTPPYNTITGYAANATVRVILYELTLAGTVIDTATANGASSVSGISF